MSTVDPTVHSTAEAARVATALGRVLPAALVPLFDASFCRSAVLYEEYVHRLMIQVARSARLEQAAGEPGSAPEIAARAGCKAGPSLTAVHWMLRHLAARGLVESKVAGGQERFQLRQPLPDLDPAGVSREQQGHDASWLPSYVLAEAVARDYPAFLRGERSGEEILFSPARVPLWLGYFSNDNGLYAINNRVGAVAVEAWLPPGGGEILELGGGLASGTIALLERLQGAGRLNEIREYRFTEAVPHFLRRGQRALQSRFPDAAFLTFGQLDMNQPLAGQGVTAGSLTAVYAVNTLHVAHDLEATLSEVRDALAPGGRLIVSECVRPRAGQPIYPEFVFNLMETFRAPLLRPPHRPNGGFLTPEQWTGAMEASGFVDVRFLPDLIRIRDEFPGFYVAAIGATRG
ncbi:MAG TPA: class I SAM-dependent methyltransferase [Methylomirabilota bacterium]|nr:class I SAM-dependent methyltransferase [Methylomirabilota bacterium]